MNSDHKPIIETMINTTALALTAFGVQQIMVGELIGYFALTFGFTLEFLKYLGRQKELW